LALRDRLAHGAVPGIRDPLLVQGETRDGAIAMACGSAWALVVLGVVRFVTGPIRAARKRLEVFAAGRDSVRYGAGAAAGITEPMARRSSSAKTGLVRCRSKPASSARRLSSGEPHPVSAMMESFESSAS
jgi:hypothetical protein